jgi:hypothetical protein
LRMRAHAVGLPRFITGSSAIHPRVSAISSDKLRRRSDAWIR